MFYVCITRFITGSEVNHILLKVCPMTEQKSTKSEERTRCETYSRVVGYLRPVNQWNDGKQEEFKLRTRYDQSPESSDTEE